MARKRTGRVAKALPKAVKPKSTIRAALASQKAASSGLAKKVKTVSTAQKKVADTKRAVEAAKPKPKPSTKGQAARRKPKAAASTPAAKPKAKSTAFGSGSSKTISKAGKALANVSKAQLDKSGLSLTAYMNKWNKTGTRPS